MAATSPELVRRTIARLNGAITAGQLNALFGYIMNILMALMMLSMAL